MPTTIKVYRVKLDRQGYDKHGVYFGVGPRLYRIVTDDGETVRCDYGRGGTYQEVRQAYKARGHVER